MTRQTNARVAGATFLLYIVAGITQIFIGSGTTGVTTAQKIASVAAHVPQIRLNLLLTLFICFTALTLAVALYGITRDEDHELSLLALICRIVEGGVVPVIAIFGSLGLMSLATNTGTNATAPASAYPVAEFVMTIDRWAAVIAATFFAAGSTIFTYLLLRGRMIPMPLAWLGVIASVILLIGLPLRLVDMIDGTVAQLMWVPMAAFEIPLGVWLIVKGVAPLRVSA